MLKLLNKQNVLIKAWLTVVMSILFIITLPLIIIILPVAAAYELSDQVVKTKKKNDDISSFFNPNLFDKWTTSFNVKRPEGW